MTQVYFNTPLCLHSALGISISHLNNDIFEGVSVYNSFSDCLLSHFSFQLYRKLCGLMITIFIAINNLVNIDDYRLPPRGRAMLIQAISPHSSEKWLSRQVMNISMGRIPSHFI